MNIGHFSTTRKLDDVAKEAMMGINLSDHVLHSFGDVVHLFVLDKLKIRGQCTLVATHQDKSIPPNNSFCCFIYKAGRKPFSRSNNSLCPFPKVTFVAATMRS